MISLQKDDTIMSRTRVTPSLIPRLLLYKVVHTHLAGAHQFLAVMAPGRLPKGMDKERVRDALPASECSVDPKGASRPHLFWPRGAIGGTVGDTVCNL